MKISELAKMTILANVIGKFLVIDKQPGRGGRGCISIIRLHYIYDCISIFQTLLTFWFEIQNYCKFKYIYQHIFEKK